MGHDQNSQFYLSILMFFEITSLGLPWEEPLYRLAVSDTLSRILGSNYVYLRAGD